MKTDLENFTSFGKKGKNVERIDGNNCIMYTRVSSKEQEQGQSLETQKRAIERFIEQRKYICLASFGGFFESASKGEREEFKRMINFARKSKEKISYILVAHSDRFDRKGSNGIYIAETLRQENIRILTVSNPVDTFTPEGKFSQNIQFVASELENDLRWKKCSDGMIDLLKEGYLITRVPMGYDQKGRGKKQLITVNATGKLLKKAFEWKAENKYTNLQIIDKLKAHGLTLKKSQLSLMFRNPFYCGIITHNMLQGEVREGKHEKLISKELFMKINNIGSKNPKGKHAKEFKDIPLKYFIKCGECGTPFSGYLVRKKNLWYYKCNKVGCKCNRNAFNLNEKFEAHLKDFLIQFKYIAPVKDELVKLMGNTQQENKENETLLKGQLSEINTRLESTEEKYIANEINRELFDKYTAKYKAEKNQITQQLEYLTLNLSNLEKSIDKYCNLLMKLPDLWASGSYDTKKEIQNFIFPEGIMYFRDIDDYRTTKINTPVLDLTAMAANLEGVKSKTASLLTSGSTLVVPLGFEPRAAGLENLCSIQLSYGTNCVSPSKQRVALFLRVCKGKKRNYLNNYNYFSAVAKSAETLGNYSQLQR